jgi:hypothetical protein
MKIASDSVSYLLELGAVRMPSFGYILCQATYDDKEELVSIQQQHLGVQLGTL